MLKKICPVIYICILLLISCTHQSKQQSYKQMFDENDRSPERLSTHFIYKARKECPNIIKDIKALEMEIAGAEASGYNDLRRERLNELKWLTGWSNKLGCKDEYQLTSETNTAGNAPEAGRTLQKEQSAVPVKTEHRTVLPSATALDLDTCFAKCREFTDRTKEGCFDTCMNR